MAETAPGPTSRSAKSTKEIHHGRTAAAWAGSTVALVAIIVGGVGLVIPNWTVFWVGVGLLVVALVVTKVLQATGHGAT